MHETKHISGYKDLELNDILITGTDLITKVIFINKSDDNAPKVVLSVLEPEGIKGEEFVYIKNSKFNSTNDINNFYNCVWKKILNYEAK